MHFPPGRRHRDGALFPFYCTRQAIGVKANPALPETSLTGRWGRADAQDAGGDPCVPLTAVPVIMLVPRASAGCRLTFRCHVR